MSQTTQKYRKTFTVNGERYDIRANSKTDLAVKVQLKKWTLDHGDSQITSRTTVAAWAEEYLQTCRRDNISDAYYQGLVTLKNIINRRASGGTSHRKRWHSTE